MSLTEQPRTCPSCAAANRPNRELCARCGVSLEDGVLPPRPVRREAPDPPRGEATPPVRRSWLVPLLGAVGLVAVVVLALTLFGLGPLATGPAVPDVQLDASRYPDEPRELLVSDVATRTASSDEGAEDAAAIVDGDPTTAWRSDGTAASDLEVLDIIDLVLGEPSWIARIELRNGDHLDREAYDSSARLREVLLRFDGGVVVAADLLDIGLRAQAVTLPEPVLTTALRVEVLRAVEGPNDQLAISDLQLVGWPALDEDRTLAEQRARVEPATGPAAPLGLLRSTPDQSS